MFTPLIVSCVLVLVLTWGWKVLNWVWLKPRRMEHHLRRQGIIGPPYKLLHGNVKERISLMGAASSKPMELSHRIVPRIAPFYHQSVERYGKTFVSWNGPTPIITTMDPMLIREALSNKAGHFSKLKGAPLLKLLVQGIVNYEGEKWSKHRRIVNPAFHLQKLKMMLPEFNTSSSELVGKWSKLVSKGSCELNVSPDLYNFAADVISRTAFGSSYEKGQRIFQLQTEQTDLYVQVMQHKYIPGLRFLPTKTNRRMWKIYREVEALLKDMITQREKAMKAGEANHDDVLGIMMESNYKEIKEGGNTKNVGMNLHEIIEECKMFYIGGQETTYTLLAWTMILLSMHREWQEKAREEVLNVFGKNAPDFEGLNQLKIVTMIFYEVLRLYPPGVTLERTTDKEMKVGEAYLPAGVELQLSMLMVHHDPDLWGDDADEFNPDRFCEGISKATKNQVAFFPFGWGPRICIGQTLALIEAKVALSMILQNFALELSPKYVHAPFLTLTVQPQHGAPLILHKL